MRVSWFLVASLVPVLVGCRGPSLDGETDSDGGETGGETGTTGGETDGASPCPTERIQTSIGSDGEPFRYLSLYTQEDVAALAGCTDVDADLHIESGVTDLRPLASLRRVDGALRIYGGYNLPTNEPPLPSLAGLEGLDSVEALSVERLGVASLEVFSGLTTIPGGLRVDFLPHLESLEGLHNIESVGGELAIQDCEKLTSLAGLRSVQRVGHLNLGKLRVTTLQGLESLAEVGVPGGEPTRVDIYYLTELASLDALDIDWHPQLGLQLFGTDVEDLDLLSGVDEMHMLGLYDNSRLADLSGLEALEVVHEQLHFIGDAALVDLGALLGLRSVGALIARETAFTDLGPLPALGHVGDLQLSGNEQLASLSGLAGLSELGSLVLEHSPAIGGLPELAGLTRVTGDFELRDLGITALGDLAAITEVGGRLVVVHNASLLQADAEAWAEAIAVGEERKVAGNKDDPNSPFSPCPWPDDGECDHDTICLDGDDEDCVIGE
ncbi:hypothetical protein [Nannocystis punicea]|uniref:Receptor L domain-containing protein n=1 Tax=Nannocystis punicea TaxID=2995304 RepID=A0ABY7H670_9BACT|nr:hypothetical protein [Nannocystis poenicansa]WAS94570.1 hypothetical protein O0S08_00285 [Nannocystis poenicansa]